MNSKNKLASILGLVFFAAAPAHAFLSASAVTTMSLPVYGVYTTTDPTCATGLMATVALSATPHTVNFAAGSAIGSGPLPATVGCAIIVIGNNLSNAWAAGTYTTTSAGGGGGGPYPDSNCNSGGSTSGQSICHSIAVTWPAAIVTDAAAVGLTLVASGGTCVGTTSEVVPLVLSTNSACTGQTAADAGTPACAGGNINNFTLPLTTADATHGTKLVAPSTAGDVNFVVNPSNSLGGIDNSGHCDNIKPPLFSFTAR